MKTNSWKLTMDMIQELHPCDDGEERFERFAEDDDREIEVTPENIRAYIDNYDMDERPGLRDVAWLVTGLTPWEFDLGLHVLNMALHASERPPWGEIAPITSRNDLHLPLHHLTGTLVAVKQQMADNPDIYYGDAIDTIDRLIQTVMALRAYDHRYIDRVLYAAITPSEAQALRDAIIQYLVTFLVTFDPYTVDEWLPYLPERKDP